MRASIFGWSYPPGVTGNEPEISGDYGPCEICGQAVDDCVCPECSICNAYGDPFCYINHGLKRTEEQKFLKEIAERQWQEEREVEDKLFKDFWENEQGKEVVY